MSYGKIKIVAVVVEEGAILSILIKFFKNYLSVTPFRLLLVHSTMHSFYNNKNN